MGFDWNELITTLGNTASNIWGNNQGAGYPYAPQPTPTTLSGGVTMAGGNTIIYLIGAFIVAKMLKLF